MAPAVRRALVAWKRRAHSSNRHFLILGCQQEGKHSLADGRQVRSGSDLHHFEVFRARAALGARPVDGHVFPLRAGRNAVVRGALFFVVDPAANQAHPGFHYCICSSRNCCKDGRKARNRSTGSSSSRKYCFCSSSSGRISANLNPTQVVSS